MVPVALAVAAVAAPIIGGIIGNKAGKKDRAAAMAALQKGMAELDRIGLPPDQSKRLLLEQFVQAGVYEPEMLEDIELAASAVSGIKTDAGLKESQMEALRSIQERGRVGLGAEDRSALNELRRGVAKDAQGRQQSLLADMARRGMSGSGSELAQSLMNAQASDERGAEGADRLAAMAAQQALAAVAQGGQMAGQIRSQDFGENQARASADDQFSMARFNQANTRQQQNIGARNEAQQQNLAQKQAISNANIQMENAERQRQLAAERQYWQDQLDKANAYMGVGRNIADQHNAQAQQKAAMWSGAGQGIGQGAAMGAMLYKPSAATATTSTASTATTPTVNSGFTPIYDYVDPNSGRRTS